MRELEIKESILRDWKRRYWHQLDKIVPDDFVWAKMARPKRKMKSYKDRVLTYFDNLQESPQRFNYLLFYCQELGKVVENLGWAATTTEEV